MYKIIDEKTTYIDENVVIGEGCIIYPNTTILGNTKIGENTVIYPSSFIKDSIIGSNNTIYTSYVLDSEFDGDRVGALIYPMTTNDLKNGRIIGIKGSNLIVKTVNLNDDWKNIELDLLEFIKKIEMARI